MIPEAIALALAAAVLHATWNVLLKTSGDPLLTMTRAMVAAAVIFTPVTALAWLLTGRPGIPLVVWGLIAVSSLAELAYAVCLSAAYRRGDLSTVYPIARGTAPLLAVPAGLLLGERLQVINWLGVVCLLAGIWIARRPARGQSATLPALLAGAFIACYSAIDTEGVHLVPPWLYGWGIWAGGALMLQTWVWLWPRLPAGTGIRSPRKRRRHRVTERERRRLSDDSQEDAHGDVHTRPQPDAEADSAPTWGRAVLIGIPMSLAYLLVLVAFHLAPLIVVAPVRESAVVLVAGWSVWKLRERRQLWQRLIGTAAVLAGIVLVAV